MKKLIFTVGLLLGTIGAYAQKPSLKVGFKTGVNLATLQGNFAEESNRLGYQAGVWLRAGGAGLYVQPEVYLGSKGGEFGKIEQNGTSYNGTGNINFTTLDIPVLIGKKFGTDKLNFRLMTGPVISFVLNSNSKDNYTVATNFDDYKNQTIGFQSGAGIDLGNISVDLRYEKGLTNIEKSGQYDQKQNLWHLSLGYRIF